MKLLSLSRSVGATGLALLVSACSGAHSSTTPTSPTVTRTPDTTFTVSGTVFGETSAGNAPLAGVLVRVAGQSGTTNADGHYSLLGVPASYGGVTAVKAGYAAAREILRVSSDTAFDFQLGPRIAIYTLSGVVSEMTPVGAVPIEGAHVEESSCEEDIEPLPPFFPNGACQTNVSQTTTTDSKGFYRLSGLYSGKNNGVWVSKEGYEDPLGVPHYPENSEGGQAVTITGDTRFDIQLVRR